MTDEKDKDKIDPGLYVDSPEVSLVEGFAFGNEAIPMAERRGQDALLHSEALPKKGTIELEWHSDLDPRPYLEGLGFQFGDEIDDLFIRATLPLGWTKRATDHALHTRLFDARGCVRAGIVYKAAFYDRHAHITFYNRYILHEYLAASLDQPEEDANHLEREQQRAFWTVLDRQVPDPAHPDLDGSVVWQGPVFPRFDYSASSDYREQARLWMNEHYPERDNPFAYWDDVK